MDIFEARVELQSYLDKNTQKIRLIKRLREETGLGLMYAKQFVEKADCDYDKALKLALEDGKVRRIDSSRLAKSGLIETYCHQGRIGVVIELFCETDFVARNDGFRALAHELAMQVASMNPRNVDELFAQSYIRDTKKLVGDLVKEFASRCGENVKVGRFWRIELGLDDWLSRREYEPVQ
jgi:elongation factor Ts